MLGGAGLCAVRDYKMLAMHFWWGGDGWVMDGCGESGGGTQGVDVYGYFLNENRAVFTFILHSGVFTQDLLS